MTADHPDIVIVMTDEERAAPPYETAQTMLAWRAETLSGRRWFDEHGVSFVRHYTGSLACVPSRPTIFTGQYPDLHGVTQTDGIGKAYDDSRLRWLRRGEVPTLGNWFRAAGYDTHYDGKWHISHADLIDPATGESLATNDDRRGDRRRRGTALPRRRSACTVWLLGMGGPGTTRRETLQRRNPPRPADRRPHRRMAERPVRTAARRRSRRPTPIPAGGQFRQPARHRAVPGLGAAQPAETVPSRPATDARPHPPRTRTCPPSRPRRSRSARPTTRAMGPAQAIERTYRRNAQQYRDLYYRLHAEVDTPIDRVRRAVTEGGSADGPDDTVLVRTSDHGDLLGAHGGLHQKWFNLYDEATRVPFVIARVGREATPARTVTAPTSHVDLVPTLLSAAGVDIDAVATTLAGSFSEVHPFPGRDLMPVVDGAPADDGRPVYLMTRDNVLEGDTGASGAARALRLTSNPPAPLRIRIPAHTAANFEGLVVHVDDDAAPGAAGHLWKLVRSFDDPGTWTEPGVRHLAADGMGGPMYRRDPLDDQWELYDLTVDPVEAVNRWPDPDLHELRAHLRAQLKYVRTESIPERNQPWPYAVRRPPGTSTRWSPLRAVRRLLQPGPPTL